MLAPRRDVKSMRVAYLLPLLLVVQAAPASERQAVTPAAQTPAVQTPAQTPPAAAQPPVAMILPPTTPTVMALRAPGRSAIGAQFCAIGS